MPYAWEAIKEITPITSRIGNATEVSPAITSPIKINGKMPAIFELQIFGNNVNKGKKVDEDLC